MRQPVAVIGFGEVGTTLADDLAARLVLLSVWDHQFPDPLSGPSLAAEARSIRRLHDAGQAVAGSSVVISAVTAAETVNAARDCSSGLGAGTWFLDLNSASPAAKSQAAAIVNQMGGRYVEAAVMSPIHPKRMAAPILLCGPHAEAFLPVAAELGFSGAAVIGSEYGVASATKLCRSILIKGFEALLMESMLTARQFGVERTVLASLSDFFPGQDWQAMARYMISRSIEHGRRRAEEMRAAAEMTELAALESRLSHAVADRQQWAAQFRDALTETELTALLDAMKQPNRVVSE